MTQESDPRCFRQLLIPSEMKTLRKALFIYQGQLYKKYGKLTKNNVVKLSPYMINYI